MTETLKDQPAEMSGGILLRYRLSGNSHPGSAKKPGADVAQTERFYRLTLLHSRQTVEVHVPDGQSGLESIGIGGRIGAGARTRKGSHE